MQKTLDQFQVELQRAQTRPLTTRPTSQHFSSDPVSCQHFIQVSRFKEEAYWRAKDDWGDVVALGNTAEQAASRATQILASHWGLTPKEASPYIIVDITPQPIHICKFCEVQALSIDEQHEACLGCTN